jgi:hypothetical protein
MKRNHHLRLSSLLSRLAPAKGAPEEIASGLKAIESQEQDLQRVSGGARMRGSVGVTCPTCSGGVEDDCGYDPFC